MCWTTLGALCLVLAGLVAGCRPAPEPEVKAASSPSRPERGLQAHAHNTAKKPAASEPRRSLGDLLKVKQTVDAAPQAVDAAPRMAPGLTVPEIDEARARAAGIRKLVGRRLTLYTDLPPGDAIDTLPEVFDRAFPQWCGYFGVDPGRFPDWHMTGFLMKDESRFAQSDLLSDDLPPFQHGYSRNNRLWLYDQPSDYYRRHLLLHEGTHGFMNATLGGCGPPWYMEGVAELLATHRWDGRRLALGHMPRDRRETPMWGRIKLVKDAVEAGQAKSFESILQMPPEAFLDTQAYGWSWAAAALLDHHPRYQARFRSLTKIVRQPDFTETFLRLLGDDRRALEEEWQVFIAELEYGHDIARTAIDFTPGKPLPARGARVEVAADRGWQNSGLRLEAGTTYQLLAAGRYQVAQEPQTWWCEPGGVSIRYYRGQPLGILLAAVRPEGPPSEPSPLLRPITIGLGARIRPDQAGTLFLKINDSPGELADNTGSLRVEVRPQ